MNDDNQGASGAALIDVGGYRLAMHMAGRGVPAVVIEPGLGAEARQYDAVAHELAREARVVWYDHAGMGQSDRLAAPVRTVADLARDLHALLAAARIPPPYVLTGHSLGGLTARYYQHCYPAEVAALVLIDSAHEEQRERLLAALPPEAPGEHPAIANARHVLSVLWNDPAANPEGIDNAADTDLMRACADLGDLPLVVLSRGRPTAQPDGYPAGVTARREQAWQQMQRELAALSTASLHFTAERSGHDINHDEPGAVVAAIHRALALARDREAQSK